MESLETGAATPDPKDAEIAQLRAELAAKDKPATADVPAEPAQETVSPLAALAESVAENPEFGFAQHLEHLAERGVNAIISPSQQEKALGVLAAIVADLVKVGL